MVNSVSKFCTEWAISITKATVRKCGLARDWQVIMKASWVSFTGPHRSCHSI